jgi:serine/threonine protein kinase
MSALAAPPLFNLPKRYEYDNETIGGGQGAVYICKDKLLERRVAVKALHTISNAASLTKEIEARAKIESKHVAEIYEVIHTSSGIPFALVLEYISGVTLQEKATHPASTDARLRLLYQLACGLNDIHAANVIHRDIKPQNIKVDEGGILKIFDLGISNLDADNASTVGGAGTFVFLAPELYAVKPLPVTRAVDIYAFGVIAWHLLAPGLPQCLIDLPPQNAMSSPLPSLASYATDLGEVASLIDIALSVSAAARPSATELKDGFRRRLTQGRRRGLFTSGPEVWELQTVGKITSFTVGSLGALKVAYDGYNFVIREVTGSVLVNNAPAAVGYHFPESCVLTFGDASLGSRRAFLSFNASQPEIVL